MVRGGYGVFYGRTPSIMLGTAHSNNGINILTYTFTGASVPTYPNRFSSIPTGGAAQQPSILVVDKDFQNPKLQQASVGVDYEVMANTSLSVSYLFVKGDSLPRSIDRNLGPLGSATYTVAGSNETLSYHRFGAAATRPFANFNRVIVVRSDGRIALQRPDDRTEPPLLERPLGARGVYARPRRRHGAGRDGGGAWQHRRRSEVRLESGGLRRGSHRWPERSASSRSW